MAVRPQTIPSVPPLASSGQPLAPNVEAPMLGAISNFGEATQQTSEILAREEQRKRALARQVQANLEQSEAALQIAQGHAKYEDWYNLKYQSAEDQNRTDPDTSLERFNSGDTKVREEILNAATNEIAKTRLTASLTEMSSGYKGRASNLANKKRQIVNDDTWDSLYYRASNLSDSVTNDVDYQKQRQELIKVVSQGLKTNVSRVYTPEQADEMVDRGLKELDKQWQDRRKTMAEAERGTLAESIFQDAMRVDDLQEDEDNPATALDVVNQVPADVITSAERNAIESRVKLQHKINKTKADAGMDAAILKMKSDLLTGLSDGTLTQSKIVAMGSGTPALTPAEIQTWSQRLLGAEKYRNTPTKSSRYNAVASELYDSIIGQSKKPQEKIIDDLVKARFDDGTINEHDFQRLMSLASNEYPIEVKAGLREAADSTIRNSGWILKAHDRSKVTNQQTMDWVARQMEGKHVPTAQEIYAKSKELWGTSATPQQQQEEQTTADPTIDVNDIKMSPKEEAEAVFGVAAANNVSIAEAEGLVRKRLLQEASAKQYERIQAAIERANADIEMATANATASPEITTPNPPQPRRGGRREPQAMVAAKGRIPPHRAPEPVLTPYERLEDTTRRLAADTTLSPADKVTARRVLTHQYVDAATQEARATLMNGYDMQTAIADMQMLKEQGTGAKLWRRWERGAAMVASAGYQLARQIEEVASNDTYGQGAAETSRMYHDVLNQPELQPVIDNWFDRYAGGAVESGPFLASTLAPAMMTGGATVPSLVMGFWSALAVEGNEAYQGALDRGEDEQAARTRGVVVGLINAGIEMGGGSGAKYYKTAAARNAMSRLEKTGRFTWQETKMALREGLAEEVPQEAVQMVMGGDAPRDAEGNIDWDAVVTRLTDTAIVGTMLGGSAATVTSIAQATRAMPEVNRSATPYIKGNVPSQYSTQQSGQRVTMPQESTGPETEKPTISTTQSGQQPQPSQYVQPPSYDELLERAAGGDEAAVDILNQIVNREAAQMPYYEDLLQRTYAGDTEAAQQIQEGRYREAPVTVKTGQATEQIAPPVQTAEAPSPAAKPVSTTAAGETGAPRTLYDAIKSAQIRVRKPEQNITYTPTKSPEQLAEEAKTTRRARVQQALNEGTNVEPKDIEEFAVEDWAQEPMKQVQARDNARRTELSNTTKAIKEHPLYQAASEGLSDQRTTGTGTADRTIYFEPKYEGDIIQYAGENKTGAMWKRITFDKTKGQAWDDAASEMGQPDWSLDDFLAWLKDAVENKTRGTLNEKALDVALSNGDPLLELLSTKRAMLQRSQSASETNTELEKLATDLAVDYQIDEPGRQSLLDQVLIRGKYAKAEAKPVEGKPVEQVPQAQGTEAEESTGEEGESPLFNRRAAGFIDLSWVWNLVAKKRVYESDVTERPVWDRVRAALDVANRNRFKVVADIKAERSRRYGVARGMYQEAIAQGVGPTEALNMAIRRSNVGPMAERTQVTPSIRNEIGDAMPLIETRVNDVATRISLFEGNHLGQAVRYLVDGNYLTRGDVDVIAKYLPQLADAAYGRIPVWDRFWDIMLNSSLTAMNVPRTALTSLLDIGTVGRQGLMFLGSNPKLYSEFYGNAWKALLSERTARMLRTELEEHPRYYDAVDHGLAMMERSGTTRRSVKRLDVQAEGYQGANLLERVPALGRMVNASERSYVEPLNVLMMNAYDKIVSQAEVRAGEVYDEARASGSEHETAKALAESYLMGDGDKTRLAHAINDMAGRTRLGARNGLIVFRSILNAIAFAPRLTASRFKLIPSMAVQSVSAAEHGLLGGKAQFINYSQGPRSIFFGLAGLAGLTAAVGLLVKMGYAAAGKDPDDVKTDVDPESGTFGKVVVDGVPFDFTAGLAQPIRFLWRMASGHRVADDGERIKIERTNEIYKMLRSKAAPIPGIFMDYMKGYNFKGDPFDLSTEVLDAMVPLIAQDAMDAFNANGLPMAIGAGIASFHGIGVQAGNISASESERILKNSVAKSVYGPYWNDLSPRQQESLMKRFTQLREAETASKRERLGHKANSIRDLFPEDVRTALDDVAATVDVSRSIAGGYRLSDERYAEYQKRAATQIELRVRRVMHTAGSSRGKTIQKAVDAGRTAARESILKDIDRGHL